MPSAAASIQLKNLTKSFDVETALKGVSLTINKGEFMVIVGPSGCGKSTMLRLVAGLEQATGGEIHIGDSQVNHVPPAKRNIAMVFQNYALYPHMTVAQNIAFGLKVRKTPREECDKLVAQAAQTLGLTPYLDKKPGELSGGQRQRVAVGRAIVKDPAVFLFDEPLSNLDAKLRGDMRAELLHLHQRLAATIMYVTHDQVEAMTLGDRICILKDGEIMQVDTPANVYDRPANSFVATFIGSPTMNMLQGNVAVGAIHEPERSGDCLDELPLLTIGELKIPLPKDLLPAGDLNGKAVTLGVRPGGLRPTTGDPTIRSKVDMVELVGEEKYIHFTFAGQQMIAAVDAHEKLDTNDECAFDLVPGKVHLFDSQGIRINT